MRSKFLALLIITALLSQSILMTKADEKILSGSDQNLELDDTEIYRILTEVENEKIHEKHNYTQKFIIKYKNNIAVDVETMDAIAKTAFESAMEDKKNKESTRQENLKTIPLGKVEQYTNSIDQSSRTNEIENIIEESERTEKITVLDLSHTKQQFKIIELPETVNPSVFMTQMRNELGSQIEYIQPDYKMTFLSTPEEETIAMEKQSDDEEPNTVTDGSENTFDEEDGTLDLEYAAHIEEQNISEIKEEKFETGDESADDGENKSETGGESADEEEDEPETMGETFYSIDNNLSKAHEKSTGNGVIIALIDTGIDTNHPAISANLTSGYDFIHGTTEVYNPGLGLEQAHGTHIAGIIVKTAPDARIIPLKVFENGTAYTSDIIAAIEFAEINGASIVNCSWGSKNNNPALREAMERSEMMFICASGNSRLDLNVIPVYPACYRLPNTISVAAFNDDFGLSYFSNYGVQSVDLVAWGREVYSALPGGEYGVMNGTSMAAGFVTGTAALLAELETDDLKSVLKMTSDRLSCLQTKSENGNKLNFFNAVNHIVKSDIINVFPADDFDIGGYQPAPEENWELFSSLDNVMVAAGTNHSIALKADGSVWTWGHNFTDELGDALGRDRGIPQRVPGLTNVVQIAVAGDTTIAATQNGQVYCWGWGLYVETGSVPTLISGISNIKSIAAGSDHFVAITHGGSIYTWGANDYGQLGDGTTGYQYSPCSLPLSLMNLSPATQIWAGYRCTYAILNSELYVWGDNTYGQLGLGTTGYLSCPTYTGAFGAVKEMAGGNGFTVALRQDGTVCGVGRNQLGQLGLGSVSLINTVTEIPGLANISTITAGGNHCIAVNNNGAAYSFGYNYRGQLGDGTTATRTSVVLIDSVSGIKGVSAGLSHTLAVTIDGAVFAWGDNYYGQTGDGFCRYALRPVLSRNFQDVDMISAGANNTVAVKPGGVVYVCGDNTYGQLGNGTTTASSSPVLFDGINGIEQASVGQGHFVFLKDGFVYTVGNNQYGQLGDGTMTNRTMLVQVPGISAVKSIVAGLYHTFAILENGDLYAWGNNSSGQLGDGTVINRSSPVKINGIANVKKVSTRWAHTLALTQEGYVYSWGNNSSGQLGDGTTTSRTAPSAMGIVDGVKDITVGSDHSVIVKNDGSVYACGSDHSIIYGQPTFTEIAGVGNIKSVEAGSIHTVAITEDGYVYAWGDDYFYGQLGIGTDSGFSKIVQVNGLYDITRISAGSYHTAAVTQEGDVYVWGNDDNGQLGIGRTFMHLVPYEIGLTGATHLEINCVEGKNYHILITYTDDRPIEDQRIYTVKYDVSKLQLADACAMTYEKNLAAGPVFGTDVVVLLIEEGKIIFSIGNRRRPSFSGILNMITFSAIDHGAAVITIE